jgi:hypothetical protein
LVPLSRIERPALLAGLALVLVHALAIAFGAYEKRVAEFLDDALRADPA